MATGGGLALPELLQNAEDAKSWFKRYEVCAIANGWDAQKKLTRLPTLLRGRAWAIFDSLTQEGETDSYDHLKTAILSRMCPDTEEDKIVARERLSQRQLCEGESVDELARDLEKFLDLATPDLPAAVRDSELRFHFINSLPEQVSLQLKLQPKVNYAQTIAKARELQLIYSRVEAPQHLNQIQTIPGAGEGRLQKLEEAVQNMSEQLAALRTQQSSQKPIRCFKCGKPGHISRQCRTRLQIECFNCGGRGHFAKDCWNQGNGRGGAQNRRAGSTPHP